MYVVSWYALVKLGVKELIKLCIYCRGHPLLYSSTYSGSVTVWMLFSGNLQHPPLLVHQGPCRHFSSPCWHSQLSLSLQAQCFAKLQERYFWKWLCQAVSNLFAGLDILQPDCPVFAGRAMNKRTPNRPGARSFGFADRFCSFVQGRPECSSFVQCTVLPGARECEKAVLITVILPRRYQLRKPW